jgi:hypothetical protein
MYTLQETHRGLKKELHTKASTTGRMIELAT